MRKSDTYTPLGIHLQSTDPVSDSDDGDTLIVGGIPYEAFSKLLGLLVEGDHGGKSPCKERGVTRGLDPREAVYIVMWIARSCQEQQRTKFNHASDG